MPNASTWKDGDGEFLLVISGTTRHAPPLAGWQQFKDHIRNVVKEQPGWADVYSSQSQQRGEMQGWARLKLRVDADATYSKCASVAQLTSTTKMLFRSLLQIQRDARARLGDLPQ